MLFSISQNVGYHVTVRNTNVTPTGNQCEKAQATMWKYEDDHINGL